MVSDGAVERAAEATAPPQPSAASGGSRRSGWRLPVQGSTLKRAAFEIVIVALGVLLALVVDQAREIGQRRELLAQTRSALRAELLFNRSRVVEKLGALSELYPLIEADPQQVGVYVRERRNRPLIPADAAWSMAVQTGAIRWLDPQERIALAQAYSNQQWAQELVTAEMARWFDLAAFTPGPPSEEEARRRAQALAVWRAWADRAFTAVCVQSARYERALGGKVDPQNELAAACLSRTPGEDPRALYREWERRGWLGEAGLPK